MAMQLTPEQERRIQAIVETGAYASAEDALEAAVAVVETAAHQGFNGSEGELEGHLLQGIAGDELSEEESWESIDRETNAMLSARKR